MTQIWPKKPFFGQIIKIKNIFTHKHKKGDLPIVDDEIKRAAGIETSEEDEQIVRSNTNGSQVQQLVTADGTYATQSAFVMNSQTANVNNSKKDDFENRPTLRGFLLQGNFFIAAALARTLTKLAFKYVKLTETDHIKQNRFMAEAMYIMASVLHFGKSGLAKKQITEDDTDSINVCLRVISERSNLIVKLFDDQSKQALSTLLDAKLSDDLDTDLKKSLTKKHTLKIQVINFYLFSWIYKIYCP